MNWRLIARLMGVMLITFSPAFVLPAIFAAYYGEWDTVGVMTASMRLRSRSVW